MPPPSVRVLLLTGTVGAGKSTVASEVNDVLAERQVPNAAIDLDALTGQWPPDSPWNVDLMFECLAALWPVYRRRGVGRLVLAHVLEDRSGLDRYGDAVPGAVFTVCRLTSPQHLRTDRLKARMPVGPSRDWHLRRTVELEAILASSRCEDFTVDNDRRPPRVVALEVLERAGWT